MSAKLTTAPSRCGKPHTVIPQVCAGCVNYRPRDGRPHLRYLVLAAPGLLRAELARLTLVPIWHGEPPHWQLTPTAVPALLENGDVQVGRRELAPSKRKVLSRRLAESLHYLFTFIKANQDTRQAPAARRLRAKVSRQCCQHRMKATFSPATIDRAVCHLNL